MRSIVTCLMINSSLHVIFKWDKYQWKGASYCWNMKLSTFSLVEATIHFSTFIVPII